MLQNYLFFLFSNKKKKQNTRNDFYGKRNTHSAVLFVYEIMFGLIIIGSRIFIVLMIIITIIFMKDILNWMWKYYQQPPDANHWIDAGKTMNN